MNELCKKNVVVGWRDELYPVASAFGEEPLFLVLDLIGLCFISLS